MRDLLPLLPLLQSQWIRQVCYYARARALQVRMSTAIYPESSSDPKDDSAKAVAGADLSSSRAVNLRKVHEARESKPVLLFLVNARRRIC